MPSTAFNGNRSCTPPWTAVLLTKGDYSTILAFGSLTPTKIPMTWSIQIANSNVKDHPSHLGAWACRTSRTVRSKLPPPTPPHTVGLPRSSVFNHRRIQLQILPPCHFTSSPNPDPFSGDLLGLLARPCTQHCERLISADICGSISRSPGALPRWKTPLFRWSSLGDRDSCLAMYVPHCLCLFLSYHLTCSQLPMPNRM